MELLESDGARPRQARYQAALRPDMPDTSILQQIANMSSAVIGFALRKLSQDTFAVVQETIEGAFSDGATSQSRALKASPNLERATRE
jgi:predicted naringenin-chalcone synthase